MSTKRVFFALWPDARQRDRLRDVINSVARNVEGRAVDRRDWHITLAWLGDTEERSDPGRCWQRLSKLTYSRFV